MKVFHFKGKKTALNNNIPDCSGVYFLWSKRELLYIGKAKNLRKRIAQHNCRDVLTPKMINPDELWKVSVIFTKDCFVAARLESELINLIPTKWNANPFYKSDWYDDWRFKEGIFGSHKI